MIEDEAKDLSLIILRDEAKLSSACQPMLANVYQNFPILNPSLPAGLFMFSQFSVIVAGQQQSAIRQLTAPHLAAFFGLQATVRALLEEGGYDVNAQDSIDRTPLSYAADRGHKAVVQLLLDGNADPNILGEQGRTPLSFAEENGHAEIINLLRPVTRARIILTTAAFSSGRMAILLQ